MAELLAYWTGIVRLRPSRFPLPTSVGLGCHGYGSLADLQRQGVSFGGTIARFLSSCERLSHPKCYRSEIASVCLRIVNTRAPRAGTERTVFYCPHPATLAATRPRTHTVPTPRALCRHSSTMGKLGYAFDSHIPPIAAKRENAQPTLLGIANKQFGERQSGRHGSSPGSNDFVTETASPISHRSRRTFRTPPALQC